VPKRRGFFDRMTTGPADAAAVDLTYLRPLAATSSFTMRPSAAVDTADDTADETSDETPADTGVVADDAPDDPQPAASITTAKPVTASALHLEVVGMDESPFGST
jgi:hypothetical protein